MWTRLKRVGLAVLALAAMHQASLAQGYERRWRWEKERWSLLGTQTVGFHTERDEIVVGRDKGRFKTLVLVARDGDVFLKDIDVVFGNGDRQHISVDDMLREGERTRAIDLEGDARFIERIALLYRAAPDRDHGRRHDRRDRREGHGKALVEVYGEQGGHRHAEAPPPPPRRDEWVELGCQKVKLVQDHDTLTLPEREDRFRALRLHVLGTGVDLKSVRVHFRSGDSYNIARPQSIHSGDYSDRMDLAEGKPRHIVRIDLDYASQLSFKGEATACVEALR